MKGSLTRIGSAAALSVATLAATPVQAQVPCAPRAVVIERLKSGYGEDLSGVGIQSTAQVVEVWIAPGTGTWTVLMSLADGKTCIIASGTDWQQLDPEPAAVGVPG